MNSDDLRRTITDALAHEERTQTTARLLAQHLKRTGIGLTPAQQENCMNFVKAYIRESPDLMDSAYQAGNAVGALSQLQPVFDAAFSYWSETHDFIPDDQGLVGIADDAYLTRLLLESVSMLQAQQAGCPLLSVDLGPANRVMRALIGEPVASKLDTLVAQTVAGRIIRSSLQQLRGVGQLPMRMPNYGSYVSGCERERIVDVQLGSMGIF